MISIIIPFYQRRTGLLQRAVRSVLNQSGGIAWRLIVVDDGSPVSAEEELAPLRSALAHRLTLIRQANRGASSARNRALDALDSGTDTVAFLDSDDAWEAAHLRRIQAARTAGADFFFEDCQRHDAKHSWFREIGLTVTDHSPIADAQDLYWFGHDFFEALFRRAPALPSTIAYKFSALPRLRFNVELSPWEDVFFCMQAAPSLQKIAFSGINGVIQGSGINISKGGWGTAAETRLLLIHRRYRRLLNALPLTPDQRARNRLAIKALNVNFWCAVLASVRRADYRCGPSVRSYLMEQPSAIAQVPVAIGETIRAKANGNTPLADQAIPLPENP
jgi:succinoglycan biosynthesis protein ExoW